MRVLLFTLFLLLFTGCSTKEITLNQKKLNIEVLNWNHFENISPPNEDFWKALQRSCKMVSKFGEYCNLSNEVELKRDFLPVLIKEKGVMTGYFEPTLFGSLEKNERFKYPIYGVPKDLIEIDLSKLYPALSKYRLRGELKNGKIIPYKSHKQIAQNGVDADVLCYVEDKIELFFLHIQGSGRVVLEDEKVLNIGYANQNGHPYVGIGKVMREEKLLEKVSLQTIYDYLEKNPNEVDEILFKNPSFIFFTIKNQAATGASGALLTKNISVAVDRDYIPLGIPLFIKNDKLPNSWVVAQDVGGAIKGASRIDYFFGNQKGARESAGELYEKIELILFLPKPFLKEINLIK